MNWGGGDIYGAPVVTIWNMLNQLSRHLLLFSLLHACISMQYFMYFFFYIFVSSMVPFVFTCSSSFLYAYLAAPGGRKWSKEKACFKFNKKSEVYYYLYFASAQIFLFVVNFKFHCKWVLKWSLGWPSLELCVTKPPSRRIIKFGRDCILHQLYFVLCCILREQVFFIVVYILSCRILRCTVFCISSYFTTNWFHHQ